MTYWLNTKGLPLLGIGLCDRCHFKRPIAKLYSDPNFPGLKVCFDHLDQFDPWRLPARPPDKLQLPFTRPGPDLDPRLGQED